MTTFREGKTSNMGWMKSADDIPWGRGSTSGMESTDDILLGGGSVEMESADDIPRGRGSK